MAQQLMVASDATAISEYTTAQLDLIKKTVAAGTSDDEFRLFVEVCRMTGLNPFVKQIYAIMRKKREKGEDGKWHDGKATMTIQTGIDGYRLLASRTEMLAGIDDAIYDTEDAEHPNKASVTVYRLVAGQRMPFTATARWSEYCQRNKDGNPTGKWGDMPFLMLAKCAEALALRKAFPAELSGVYTAEEMEQADNPPLPYVEQAPAAPPAPPVAPVDRIGAAIRDQAILDALVSLQRFTEADRRAEVQSVFGALEQRGQRVTNKTVLAELNARLTDLATLDTGAPGN